MDLNDLQIFVKVVESKSLTIASDQLGIPKSTLSRRLALLEEHLGVHLVQRTTRHFSLTDVGAAYYARCTEILASILQANQLVSDLQDTPRGRLRISVAPSFAGRYVGAIISSFIAEYPDITIELVSHDRVANMLEEAIDVLITCSHFRDPKHAVTHLAKGTMVLCSSPAYLERHGAPERIEDLYSHRLALFLPDGVAAFTLSDGVATHEMSPPAHMLGDHYEPIRDAVVAGAGIGCFSELTIARELATGELVRILPEWSAGLFEIVAVYPKRQTLPPRLQLFLEHLSKSFDPVPWSRERRTRVEEVRVRHEEKQVARQRR
jgi:DNA-binding transcriptional LysR family regulator